MDTMNDFFFAFILVKMNKMNARKTQIRCSFSLPTIDLTKSSNHFV